jgi:hypothetical protein
MKKEEKLPIEKFDVLLAVSTMIKYRLSVLCLKERTETGVSERHFPLEPVSRIDYISGIMVHFSGD